MNWLKHKNKWGSLVTESTIISLRKPNLKSDFQSAQCVQVHYCTFLLTDGLCVKASCDPVWCFSGPKICTGQLDCAHNGWSSPRFMLMQLLCTLGRWWCEGDCSWYIQDFWWIFDQILHASPSLNPFKWKMSSFDYRARPLGHWDRTSIFIWPRSDQHIIELGFMILQLYSDTEQHSQFLLYYEIISWKCFF